MEAPQSLAGQTERCPKCQSPNRVPPQERQDASAKRGKSLLIAVVIVGLIAAAGVGGYVAVRQGKPIEAAHEAARGASPPPAIGIQQLPPIPTPAASQPPKPLSIVRGGAWVTRNGGSSDLLRGLEIALLNDTLVDPAIIRAEYQDKLRRWTEIQDSRIKDYDTYKGQNNEVLEQFNIQSADEAAKVIALLQRKLATVTAPENLSSAYKHFKAAKEGSGKYDVSYWGTTDFFRCASTVVRQRVHANSDGKFTFTDVPPGRYYLYAVTDNSISFIEWLVPIDVADGKEVNCDLFNENAATIYNKN